MLPLPFLLPPPSGRMILPPNITADRITLMLIIMSVRSFRVKVIAPVGVVLIIFGEKRKKKKQQQITDHGYDVIIQNE